MPQAEDLIYRFLVSFKHQTEEEVKKFHDPRTTDEDTKNRIDQVNGSYFVQQSLQWKFSRQEHYEFSPRIQACKLSP